MYWDGQGWTAPPPPPPQKKSSSGKRVLFTVVTVFIGLVIIGTIGNNDDKTSSSTSSPSSAGALIPGVTGFGDGAPATPTAAPAGSAVRDGKFEFRVLGMERAAVAGDLSNQFMTEKAQGEFVILTMSVRNIGDEPQSYFGENQKLIDTSGREYGANSAAGMWMNSNSATSDINPGNQIQVRVAFDVPPGTVPAELEVHDSMFSGGATVRL